LSKKFTGRLSKYSSGIDRLFVILFSLLIIAFLALVFFVYENFRDEKHRAFQNEAFYSSKIYSELIESHISHLREKLQVLAVTPSIMNLDTAGESMITDLYEFHNEKDFVKGIARISPDMQILYMVPSDLPMDTGSAAQNHFQDVLREKRTIVSNPFSIAEGLKVVALSVPVFENDTYSGSLSLLIDFDALSKFYLSKIQVRGTGKSWIVDSEGSTILLPGYSGKMSAISLKTELRISLLKEMRKEREGITKYKIMDKSEIDRYLSYSAIRLGKNQNWFVCIDASESEINEALPHFGFFEPYCIYPFIVFLLMATLLVISYILMAKHYAHLLEKQLLQAQKMETSAIFINGIAHDFNNIIQLMKGIPELLNESDGKPFESDIRLISDITERAAKLTAQLTNFYLRATSQYTNVDLNKCAENTSEILQRFLDRKIIMETEFADDLPFLKASLSETEQLLMNLCINARDAMPKGGTIVLKTELISIDSPDISLRKLSRTPHILLSVSDTGIGMSKEVQKNIFVPFYTTKGTKGTGIGLSTVAIIVDNLKGRIFVESKEGAGSKFLIYLPV
jgi:signal transduction histidine kinase